jgi:folylpolyglutamate synthase/dihydropteroate synthase
MAPPEGLWLFQQWVNNQPANPQSALGIVTGSLYTAGEIRSLVTEQEN